MKTADTIIRTDEFIASLNADFTMIGMSPNSGEILLNKPIETRREVWTAIFAKLAGTGQSWDEYAADRKVLGDSGDRERFSAIERIREFLNFDEEAWLIDVCGIE